MYILLGVLAYFYFAIGIIIGFKLMSAEPKWYMRAIFVMLMAFIWLPNIPADIIASNVKSNLERS